MLPLVLTDSNNKIVIIGLDIDLLLIHSQYIM